MASVTLNAAAVGGTIQTSGSGTIIVPTNGLIVVNSSDVPDLLKIGCTYVNIRVVQTTMPIPRAATAARVVTSTSLSNGTVAIANQPDCPRVCALAVATGTSAITAGTTAMVYTANDGTTQTDTFSLVAAASSATTTNTSKGVVHLTSVTTAGLVGGASPGVQVNDTNILSMIVDTGFVNFLALKESVDGADETIGTVTTSAASISPTTAPNGTHNYSFMGSFTTTDT